MNVNHIKVQFSSVRCVRSILAAAALLVVGLFSPYSAAIAAGDAEAGKAASVVCAACHGADGYSAVPTFPILAGQYESYLVQALKDYRSGARENAVMAGFASALSDKQIADLAAYFTSQQGFLRTVTPD